MTRTAMTKPFTTRTLALAAAALTAFTTLPASAALLVQTHTTGTSTVTDYSGAGLVSFDLDLTDGQPLRLDFQIEAGDGPRLDFNAIVRNFASLGLTQLALQLTGGSFALGGSATGFGVNGAVHTAGTQAEVLFATPQYLDIVLGDPLASGSPARDWQLDIQGLRAGDLLSIAIRTVPEPTSLLLALAGLGLLVLARRARPDA